MGNLSTQDLCELAVVCLVAGFVMCHVAIIGASYVYCLATVRIWVRDKRPRSDIAMVPFIVLPFLNSVAVFSLTEDGRLATSLKLGIGRAGTKREESIPFDNVQLEASTDITRLVRNKRVIAGYLALVDLLVVSALLAASVPLVKWHIAAGDASDAFLLTECLKVLLVLGILGGYMLCAFQVAITNLSGRRVLSATKVGDDVVVQLDDLTCRSYDAQRVRLRRIPLMPRVFFKMLRCVSGESRVLLTAAVPGVIHAIDEVSRVNGDRG